MMLDEYLTDEQYEQEPTELEELEKLDVSLDRPCIRECKSCIEENFCPDKKFEDKCIWCNYRYSDTSKCENC